MSPGGKSADHPSLDEKILVHYREFVAALERAHGHLHERLRDAGADGRLAERRLDDHARYLAACGIEEDVSEAPTRRTCGPAARLRLLGGVAQGGAGGVGIEGLRLARLGRLANEP